MADPPSLPSTVPIDGVTYDILRLGTPVYKKAPTKVDLLSLGFTVEDLTLVGLPTGKRADNGDEHTFHWMIYCFGAANKKLVSADLLKEVIEFSRKAGRLPIAPPGNRTTITTSAGVAVQIPVIPEAPVAPKKSRGKPVAPPTKKTKTDSLLSKKSLDALLAVDLLVDETILGSGGGGRISLFGPRNVAQQALDDAIPNARLEGAFVEDNVEAESAPPPVVVKPKPKLTVDPTPEPSQSEGVAAPPSSAVLLFSRMLNKIPEGAASWREVQEWARILAGGV